MKVPPIIKETLGEDISDMVQQVMNEPRPERTFVIYGSPQAISAIDDAITEELKKLIVK